MPTLTLRQRVTAALGVLRGSVRNEALYNAGSQSTRTMRWRPPTASANSLLGSLGTLRDRSRAAVRNDGYAKGVIEKLVTNLIGTGIKPLSQAPDPQFREAVQRLFNRWVDEADADGQHDFYGLQALAVRIWMEGGDSFTRMRARLPEDGLSVPLQLQVLEPELVPYAYDAYVASTNNRVRAGIEFDPIGRRVAYYFHPTRPEFDDFNASELRRVPAESVAHLFEVVRGGQLRGLPILTQALVKLHELDQYDDASLVRQKVANLFAAFITRPPGPNDLNINPMTGEIVADTDEAQTVELNPAIVQELNAGEEVSFADPPDPPQNYAEFFRQHLRSVSVASGVPYEVLTGDMTGLNDRTMRVVLNEFKRRMQMVQHSVIAFRFCRPVWNAWIDRAILAGALPTPAGYGQDPTAPWAAVKWTPQRWAYIHPVQDVEAQVAEMRAGLASRSGIVSENGEDAEQIDREQQQDNARADKLGLKYSSDGRNPTSGPTTNSMSAEPDPAPVGAAA